MRITYQIYSVIVLKEWTLLQIWNCFCFCLFLAIGMQSGQQLLHYDLEQFTNSPAICYSLPFDVRLTLVRLTDSASEDYF